MGSDTKILVTKSIWVIYTSSNDLPSVSWWFRKQKQSKISAGKGRKGIRHDKKKEMGENANKMENLGQSS